MERQGLEELFGRLNRAGIRYLVAGGLAVVAHGHARLTMDVDLVLDLRPSEVTKALEVLQELEYRPQVPVALEDFADRQERSDWFENRHMRVLSVWSPRFPLTEVDLFVVSPLPDFERAYGQRLERELAPGIVVSFVGREDLLAMKLEAGRPEDLADVRALEALEPGESA
jgi:hypothetical protein